MRYKVFYQESCSEGTCFHPCKYVECYQTELEDNNMICYDRSGNIVGVFNTCLTLIKVEEIKKES